MAHYEEKTTTVAKTDYQGNTVNVTPARSVNTPVTDAEKEQAERPVEDVLSFLQRINRRLKNAQTANHPTTVVQITEEIDQYLGKLGSGKVQGYKIEHRDGKARAVAK